MLQEMHRIYREAFRESTLAVRLQLIYLLVVPGVLVGVALYLLWLYFMR
ncbi:MAG: hypothetical protein ACOY94_28235 [Bacillota bacterium]